MNNKLTYNQWLSLCKLGNFCFDSHDVSYSLYREFKRVIITDILGIKQNTDSARQILMKQQNQSGTLWMNNRMYDMWNTDMEYTDENMELFNKVREIYLNRNK